MIPNPTSPRPITSPSPKQLFLQSVDNISKHRDMLENRVFERAVDYALMQYQLQLSAWTTENPQNAAYAGLKMCGAQEFLHTLRTLSEVPALPTPPANQNLNHTV